MLSRVIKSSSASATASIRYFSTSRAMLIESGSNIGKDSFHEKERAQENVYIKKQEEAQLKKLKEKLEEQKKTIENLEEELKNHKSK
ncbi:hypothetical protein CORT_0B06360 [Candida orthopsilosis Co 90-125]|uniref:ATPase inhibitor, mitochondrial n=1 Tax=Candida orthopsilosis (strain 90-125) TaxID=1136231 RepID=H8X000_CANO9|nr:hypothetical protein CORT_0B06360 [Candida orthopsilosis Co 90-125]CCG22345.1 hypothetical protein CORT_0B06360 [Candida orthopsilosis Co 90-125]